MKRFKQIALWGGILLYLAVALSFVNKKRERTICSKVKVTISDSLQDQFITRSKVQNIIHNLGTKIRGEETSNINIRQIERYLADKPLVKQAELYFTGNGDLHIRIDQRNPIVRVINARGRSYYIDPEGVILPVSQGYTSHVLVASGEIKEFFEPARQNKLPCPGDYDGKKNYAICKIFDLARFIHNHPFWEAQIEQIYLNREGEYELIPRVGGHLINWARMRGTARSFDT